MHGNEFRKQLLSKVNTLLLVVCGVCGVMIDSHV